MKEKNANLEVTILIIDQDLAERDYKKFLKLVSKEKQERIGHFHFYKSAQTALLADILARYEICKRTGLANWQLHFSENEYGKPFLVNDPHVQYNLSHSGKYIAFAIDSKPVGIDVEQIKPIDFKIANRFFTADENHYITSQRVEMKTIAFYRIWTKKESYIKLEGKGLSIALSSFSVLDNPIQKYRYHNMLEDRDDAVCSVCTASNKRPSCNILGSNEFLGHL